MLSVLFYIITIVAVILGLFYLSLILNHITVVLSILVSSAHSGPLPPSPSQRHLIYPSSLSPSLAIHSLIVIILSIPYSISPPLTLWSSHIPADEIFPPLNWQVSLRVTGKQPSLNHTV